MVSDRDLVRRLGADATVEQTLNPDLERWRGPEVLVAYRVGRATPGGRPLRVTAGGPIGPAHHLGGVVAAFEADATDAGHDVVWFGIEERILDTFRGHTPLVVGAQPVWSPRRWPEILASKASLRAQVNRAKNKGVVVERWDRDRAASSPHLHRLLDEWIARRGMPSLHFLAEPDVLGHLGDREVFVATRGPEAVAYLLAAPVPARDGWLVEWIIRGEAAPNGTASLLLDAAFRLAIDTEAAFVSLGLVPLSSHAPLSAPAPPRHVRALLAWMRAHAERFYGFRGLERFKAKFEPDAWAPVYVLTREAQVTLRHLHAVADAFAGAQSPEALVTKAIAKAAASEARAAARWFSSRGTGTSRASPGRSAERSRGAARRGSG